MPIPRQTLGSPTEVMVLPAKMTLKNWKSTQRAYSQILQLISKSQYTVCLCHSFSGQLNSIKLKTSTKLDILLSFYLVHSFSHLLHIYSLHVHHTSILLKGIDHWNTETDLWNNLFHNFSAKYNTEIIKLIIL